MAVTIERVAVSALRAEAREHATAAQHASDEESERVEEQRAEFLNDLADELDKLHPAP